MRTKGLESVKCTIFAGILAVAGTLSGVGTVYAQQTDPILQQCLGAPGVAPGQSVRALELQVIEIDRAVRAAYNELPFEELRVEDAQSALGSDPLDLFAFVRDETRWLPYAGALRGAQGVMLDRMGSSLDRALLLAALIERAGHDARLVRSALPDAGFSALQGAWSSAPLASRVEPGEDDVDVQQAIAQVAERQGLDADDLEALHREQQMTIDQTLQRLAAQALRQQTALESVLEQQAGQGSEPLSLAEVTDHWWVEWRSGDGWITLDPSLPTYTAGDRLVTGDEVEHYYPESLPDEAYHRLRVQVVAEQWAGDRLQEHVALDHYIKATELLGQQLHLEMYPVDLPSQRALLNDEQALHALPDQVLGERQWIPYLRVGEGLVRQRMINVDGTVEEPGQVPTARAFGEATSILGSIGVGGRADEPMDPELTAVFLRFTVEEPGRITEVFERPVMDVLGSAARETGGEGFQFNDEVRDQRAAALLSTIQLLGQTTWLPPEQQTAWRYEALMDNRRASLGTAYAATHADFSFMGDTLEARSMRRTELDQLAGLRLTYSPHLEQIALTRLNLLGYVTLVDYQNGILRTREGFDILDNRVDVPSGNNVRSVRLAQGVLDTLLEAELLSGELTQRSNAAIAFAHDLDQQREWIMIEEPGALGQLDWQPDADLRVHFAQLLGEGRTLVMPAAVSGEADPVWWQLDPVNGDVLGYGPDRRGQAVEALLTLLGAADNAVGAVEMVQTIWDCLLTSEDPHCCARTAAAGEAIERMAGRGLAGAAHAQRVNLVIGRSIVHGSTFRMLNEAAIGNVADGAAEVFANATTMAMGCS